MRPVDFSAEPAYLGISRNHPLGASALDAFNRGMAIITKDGTVKKLQETWAKRAVSLESAKTH